MNAGATMAKQIDVHERVSSVRANMGSNSRGFTWPSTAPARLAPSWRAIEPAILNAISEESTAWEAPSVSVTLKSRHG